MLLHTIIHLIFFGRRLIYRILTTSYSLAHFYLIKTCTTPYSAPVWETPNRPPNIKCRVPALLVPISVHLFSYILSSKLLHAKISLYHDLYSFNSSRLYLKNVWTYTEYTFCLNNGFGPLKLYIVHGNCSFAYWRILFL